MIKMVQVDKMKLRREISKRGMTMPEASLAMGFNSQYLQNCSNRGFISKSSVVMLDRLFGLKPEDFSPDEVIQHVGKKDVEIDRKMEENIISKIEESIIPKDELRAIILDAVKQALIEVFN